MVNGRKDADVGAKNVFNKVPFFILVPIYILLIAVVGFCAISWKAYRIPNSSMEPALKVGDHILVNRAEYIFGNRKPIRGDIVVFVFPQDKSKDYVKRVVGVPGDTISIKNRIVTLNGVVFNEDYAILGSPDDNGLVRTHDNVNEFTVPMGKYYVLGDNRDKSYDSRFWGFVGEDSIIGKARYIYYAADTSRMMSKIK